MARPARPPTARPRPAGGAAILTALLTVALVASLAVAAFWQQWRSIEFELWQRQQLQGQWLVAGALEWARTRVGQDGVRSPAVDHLGEAWAQPVQQLPLADFLAQHAATAGAPGRPGASGAAPPASPSPGGPAEPRLSLRLSDAQGRLNLLNLLEGQAVSPTWLAVFGRLFEQLGLPSAELERLAEQLRRANLGTLDAQATADASPAQAPTAGDGQPVPLVPLRQADLAWLGLQPATVQALAAHVSLLPGRLPVNLNTAGAEVLQAVLGLPAAQVQALLARRQAQPFANLQAVGLPQLDAQMHAVSSHFFEVQVRLELGGNPPVTWLEHALLQRDGGEVRTLWQRRDRPELPAAGEPARRLP